MLPVVVAAAMLGVFAIGPLFGLPLIGRYVRTTSILLMLFYGVAVAGWMLLPRGSAARKRWMVAGLVALVASVAYLPAHASMLRGLESRTAASGLVYADLRDVGQSPVVRDAFARCAPLSTADRRPIPYLRHWLGGEPGSVGTVASGASPLGRMLLVPRRVATTRRFYRETMPRVKPPAGYRTLYRNRSWRVYAAEECVTRPPS
jgi:hypothetical protein